MFSAKDRQGPHKATQPVTPTAKYQTLSLSHKHRLPVTRHSYPILEIQTAGKQTQQLTQRYREPGIRHRLSQSARNTERRKVDTITQSGIDKGTIQTTQPKIQTTWNPTQPLSHEPDSCSQPLDQSPRQCEGHEPRPLIDGVETINKSLKSCDIQEHSMTLGSGLLLLASLTTPALAYIKLYSFLSTIWPRYR